jgi:lipoprotein-anchoring transpeptidase ErfK/SrfK
MRLDEADYDDDGLSDKLEYHFKTNPTNPDTDGDGHADGAEVYGGFNPADANPDARLEKSVRIDKANQMVSYFAGDVRLGMFIASTGKPGWGTPSGEFAVIEKHPRRWSNLASLWMPYWLMFTWQGHGLHELPEWPNGYKEGQDHLGMPVSHGCVRLGVGSAEELYNFAELGTKVYVN